MVSAGWLCGACAGSTAECSGSSERSLCLAGWKENPCWGGAGGEDWPGCVVLLTGCPGSETWQALPFGGPGALWGALIEFSLTLECMGASLLVMAVSQSLLQEW